MRAVVVRVDRGIATVELAIVADRPADVDPADTEMYGKWIAERLRRSHCAVPGNAGDVIVVLDREQATIRLMELPTLDSDELPDMARLTMQRDTHVEGGSLAVDFLERTTGAHAGGDAGTTSVLVAAASQRVIDFAERLVEAMGGKSPVVTLRLFGVMALLREQAMAAPERAMVGIDANTECIELIVLRGEELLYTRGVRLADSEALASEVKRSWMSYRFTQKDEAIANAVVFADSAARDVLSAGLTRIIGAPLAGFAIPDTIRIGEHVDREAVDLTLPLVGLAIDRASGRGTIDLASPRRAPDLAARRRIRLLAAAGVLILVGFAGWTIGNIQRKGLEQDVNGLRVRATNALPELDRFKRDTLKLEHLKTWAGVQPAWLDHALYLHAFAPDPSSVVLNSFIGSIDASDVQYSREQRWSIVSDMKVTLDGEARDRSVADALRDALVENGHYTVTSTGADTEGGRRLSSPFSYVLRTRKSGAPEEKRSQSPGAGGDANGAPAMKDGS